MECTLKKKNSYKIEFCGWSNLFIRLLFMISIALSGSVYQYINRITTKAHIIDIFIDTVIPFNKYFVLPYLFWYFYVIGAMVFLASLKHKRFYGLLLSINIGLMISYAVYLIFPTYVARPHIVSTDMFSKVILDYVYGKDLPHNCCPSIHVLETTLVMLYIQKEKYIHKFFKIAVHIVGILIILSTMFLKQHYFIDVVLGATLGYSLYYIFEINYAFK